MSLLQESRKTENNSKKIYMICGIGIIVLIFIIVGLLAYLTAVNKNKVSLVINGNNYVAKEYLINKDNNLYIGLEDLVKAISSDGYTYRSGNKDVEDENQCYVTNSTIQESVFFKVGTSSIYKITENTNEVIQYNLSNPVIKENGKIYIPLEDCRIALNMRYSKYNNQYAISSIEFLEKYYNQQSSSSFVPDSSIVWNTLAANKKMLREGLVIVKDNFGNLGLATVSRTTDSKKKITTVSTTQLITPKYKYIKYVEKYNQFVVETQSGRGIVELIKSEDGSYTVKTVISPQYRDIKNINQNMYIISENNSEDNSSVAKYGIINSNGEEILPAEYQKIGIDAYEFTNNHITNEYIIYDYLIPVKKDNLWGFVNLNGQTVINTRYTNLGCTESNASSNVLIIPNKELIVVQEDKNYGIITKTGKVVIKSVLSRVFQESDNNEDKYYMIYNDKKVDVLKYYNQTVNTHSSNEVEQNDKVAEDNNQNTANQNSETIEEENADVIVVN